MRWLRGWIGVVILLASGPGIAATANQGPQPCEQIANSVLIQVQGVHSSQGTLVAELYGDTASDFLKKAGRIVRERVAARSGSVSVCLAAPRPGVYAVVVYHDENDNHRFDRAWNGLPAEGFGVSNNPRPFMRPPTLAEAAFEVGSGHRVMKIELRY